MSQSKQYFSRFCHVDGGGVGGLLDNARVSNHKNYRVLNKDIHPQYSPLDITFKYGSVWVGGGALGHLKMGWNFHFIDPRFLTFSDPIGSLFMPNSMLLTPSFCKKDRCVSITFSSRNNLT